MATITSLGIGSGLDLNGLLDDLKAAERGKLTPITTQKKTTQAKISAFGNLSSALSKFQPAVATLNDAKRFSAVTSKVTGSGVAAVASADAPAGRFKVNLNQLATAATAATAGVDSRTAPQGAGKITFSFGGKDDLVVEVAEGKSSLEAIRDAVNSKEAGVSASIVFDGEQYRLAFASTETGEKAGLEDVKFEGFGDDALALEGDVIKGQNAKLTVNGIAITSHSNKVEGAIQGVTLNLSEIHAEGSSSTIAIDRDSDEIKNAVKGFVEGYNTLRTAIRGLTSYNADTGVAGDLLGDSTLRGVESRLRSVIGGGIEEGQLRMLSDLGITLQLDGTLKLDEAKLDGIIATESMALADFFAGGTKAGGMAGKLVTALDQILGDKGLLSNATSGLETTLKGLDQRYARMETQIDATIARYRSQFSQLDSMIARMNQTSGYLTQQFDLMNAQLGRKK
ncbi:MULTISPECIES: flagellar filament capping protein FliD [Halomonadaceae]|uniref:flagellar filament capping protein FliD n=1 Tax=Halomonadaceae TaxID=28256 RepID=UPI001598B886|nr:MULTISPECIES: flagellar filament capping protein FliD [Halomonas]QJQ96555.1 flagellar filament capping protein FliD [Halomonas sp. PA5]